MEWQGLRPWTPAKGLGSPLANPFFAPVIFRDVLCLRQIPPRKMLVAGATFDLLAADARWLTPRFGDSSTNFGDVADWASGMGIHSDLRTAASRETANSAE
ncbi:unnamed protein product [Tuwongella immobilis]|uniref:Uncharacterized protein n=1 Tax=Tuwongella immobilis TaxID=692036 RepID=A0A6C2YVH4_9BACT|nr:unnamed protein product [Tuwongella immobilis]VTS08138.1 unnamed protein product [Tuwongella immobilis]